jgi:hypothetical protein
MFSQTSQHRNIAVISRQQHNTRSCRLDMVSLSNNIAVELRSNIEVVHSITDAGADERVRSVYERPGAIELISNTSQSLVDYQRVEHCGDPVINLVRSGGLLDRSFVPAGQNDMELEISRVNCC